MCLNIDPDFHPSYSKGKAAVADRPILVYKHLISRDGHSGVSPYQYARWVFGEEKTVRKFEYSDSNSYYRNSTKTRVGCGLHAFFTKDANRAPLDRANLYPAVIPVGARFWIGRYGEIVATAMTVYKDEKSLLAAYGATAVGEGIPRSNYKQKRSR